MSVGPDQVQRRVWGPVPNAPVDKATSCDDGAYAEVQHHGRLLGDKYAMQVLLCESLFLELALRNRPPPKDTEILANYGLDSAVFLHEMFHGKLLQKGAGGFHERLHVPWPVQICPPPECFKTYADTSIHRVQLLVISSVSLPRTFCISS